jgi:hypothetical protein
MVIGFIFLLLQVVQTPSAPAQGWSDRGEYDLALEIRAQPDPAARIALLDQWRQKYPKSALNQSRAELYLSSYQALGDPVRMMGVAREMCAAGPDNYVGLYWITVLAPSSAAVTPATLSESESAAKRLLAATDNFFAQPAMTSASSAAREKSRVQFLARRTLGWVEWKRGNLEAAERELQLGLQFEPQSAEVSAWLGTILALRQTPAQQTLAIWHLARAAYLDGDGALPSAQRRDVRALLETAYTAYHGSDEGLDQVGAATRQGTLPALGFKIETTAEVAERQKEEEFLRANPDLLPWLRIRKRLLASSAETQQQTLNETTLPRLKGTLIRCNTPVKPTDIYVGIIDPSVEEVLIKVGDGLARCADPGTVLEFDGGPASFDRHPFLLTVLTPIESLQGWPKTTGRR